MGRHKGRSILGQHIAEILGTGGPFGPGGQPPAFTRSLLLGGVALLSMSPAPVNAIGLGEITLESRLGQPLRATVPMRVAKGEILPANCVTAKPRQTGLRTPKQIHTTSPPASGPGDYAIQITTVAPLHEPMYELSVVVECPNVSSITHHYVLMIELPDYPIQTAAVDLDQVAPAEIVKSTDLPTMPALAPASPDQERDRPPAPNPAIIPARLLTATREAIPAGRVPGQVKPPPGQASSANRLT